MIYTGSYKSIEDYPGVHIAISRIVPSELQDKIIDWKALSPAFLILNDYKSGKIDRSEFKDRYFKQLNEFSKKDKKTIHEFLTSFQEDVFLLCYEKKTDFCHRHLLAEWLNKNFKLGVKEYEKN